MRNIQKIGIALTFIAFSSLGCSSASNKVVSSNPSSVTENPIASSEEVSSNPSSVIENPSASNEEVSSDISSITENPGASSEEVSSDISSITENPDASSEEVSSDISSITENPGASSEEVSSDISSIIENPVVGTKVTLRGKIVEQMEDRYIFTDGNNKILIDFEDENLSYDPNTMVEISGTVEQGMTHESDNFEAGEDQDASMDTMIMVNQMEVIASSKQ